MAWTWDTYRASADRANHVAAPQRQKRDDLGSFMTMLDGMLYVAAAALIACIAALLII